MSADCPSIIIGNYLKAFCAECVTDTICDQLCENPPCLHILHGFTQIAVKF